MRTGLFWLGVAAAITAGFVEAAWRLTADQVRQPGRVDVAGRVASGRTARRVR